MNELMNAATRFFNAAAALLEATLDKEYGKKAEAAASEPKPERKPRAPKTETKVEGGEKTTTTDNGNGTGSVSVGPAAPAKTEAPAAGNASAMTTETARPRIVAVAQKIGSIAVKEIIKKETGCAALADVPAEKLPALVAAVEAAGAAGDV